MRQWDFKEIKEEIEALKEYYWRSGVVIHKFIYSTTNTHVLELFGECNQKAKVKGGKFWSVTMKEDNIFQLMEVHIMYSGKPLETDVFVKADYGKDKEKWNPVYAETIERLQDKDYECRKQRKQGKNKANPHNFVVVELNQDGQPEVKSVTFPYVYYFRELYEQAVEVRDLDNIPTDFGQTEYDGTYLRYLDHCHNMYDEKTHLTKLYVKADITYRNYEGEEKVYHIDRKYSAFYDFEEELRKLKERFEVLNKEGKWYQLAGMDINKMNQLASYLGMEVYFRHGFLGLGGKGEHSTKRPDLVNWIKLLEGQESYEDYLTCLADILEGLDKDTIKAAFEYLRENGDENPLSITHRFIEPYFRGRYEVGKVYFADVVEESLARLGAPRDGLVKLCDEKTHYKFMGEILFNHHVFNHAENHCYPHVFLAEYFDYYGWIGKAEKEAYLVDNIHETECGLRPHGYEYKTIPVRIVGYRKDGMPIVKYVKEYHFM